MIVAHPDDIDFGSGGSVARWVAEGNTVDYCICTDGDAGGYDEAVGRTEMAELRRQEQRAAPAAVWAGSARSPGSAIPTAGSTSPTSCDATSPARSAATGPTAPSSPH